jgi:hypothetical protein
MTAIAVILLLDFVAALFAARIVGRRTRWLGGWVAVTAALPFPLACAILAAVLEGPARLVGKEDGVSMGRLLTIGVGATMLYLFGLIVAAFAVKPGRKPPYEIDNVADIFS